MVNRTTKKRDGELDKFTRLDAAAAINFISENLTSIRSQNNPRFDDLIGSLANAHENRRARQVTEWERMRQHNAQRVA